MSTEAVTPIDDAVTRPATASEVEGAAEGSDRWRLHRGGIVNIWQYANKTFDLDGGRTIFQGTNGSGKSRTLELLLPLCLDGDLRQIGSKGFDTVSMRRLMLDEREGTGNRVGYAWLELRRTDEHGADEFLTCGVGVKAAAGSNQISDSWRFLTGRRVNHDLHLAGSGDIPLGHTQLRDELGTECVLDEQAFRARIAATVYGITAERYADLLHLQRTLRNPDVGLKVQEGQLEQLLSDALPPLDSTLVGRLASSFEDLESIRENILRLSTADSALAAFMSTYSGYALGVLRDRAARMREAERQSDAVHGSITELDDQVRTKQREHSDAEERVCELESRDRELESTLQALRESPAYTELQNLHDRRRLVERARESAEESLNIAARHRDQEHRSVTTVLGMLRRLGTDARQAGRHSEHATDRLAASGLDGSLVPVVPEVAAAESSVHHESVRGAAEEGSEWLHVERHVPPQPDTEALAEHFREVDEQAQQAATAARERAALTLSLHQRACDSDREKAEVDEAYRQAERARTAATEAAARRNQLRQDLADTAEEWVMNANAWWRDGLLGAEGSTDAAEPTPAVPAVEDLVADRYAARSSRERVRDWARPHLHRARMRITEAEQDLSTLRSTVAESDRELSELRSGHEKLPTRPSWATAHRDEQEGSPLYRLVDFAESVPVSEHGPLEGALESSGLLDSWVAADGTVRDPDRADMLATPCAETDGARLAELLVPAVGPDSPVSESTVAALLRSIPIEAERGSPAILADGRWQAGVLSGAWHKPQAEYVGAGARQAARDRRIAELESELARLRAEVDRAAKAHSAAQSHAAELDRELEAYPDDGELFSAHARLAGAIDDAAEAERSASRLRGDHERLEQHWRAGHTELEQAAAQAGLRADTDALDSANRAAGQARDSISALRETISTRCLGTLEEFGTTTLHHDATVADRMAAESEAEQRSADYAEQAAALAELTASVGEQGQRVAEQVHDLEQQRAQVREELPRMREKASAARADAATLTEKLSAARSESERLEADSRTCATAFRQALSLPAFWTAALGTEEGVPERPSEPSEAAQLIEQAAATQGRTVRLKDVNDKLLPLKQSLSGHFDIVTDDSGEALTVTVSGEEGPLPVADAARRIAARLREQREYLNERYQGIFADYLIRDLAERLRAQINVAEDLCRRMNRVLDGARSSQGVHVQLEWQPAGSLGEDMRQAIEVVRTPFANRSEEQDALLRRVFTDLIESQRESVSGGYAEILGRALDYRDWYEFTVRVRDTDPAGEPRVRKLRQLSSGETRLISYVTLFAAAASFYDAIESAANQYDPLRLVLLDEAFERLDDPTVARMLGLLVDLDMDWMITWPSGWGVSPKIPKMHIYDVLRPRSGHGIACTHTVWTGRGLERVEQ